MVFTAEIVSHKQVAKKHSAAARDPCRKECRETHQGNEEVAESRKKVKCDSVGGRGVKVNHQAIIDETPR